MAIRKHYKMYARSRIQRAFLLWFKEARKRLAMPFRITKRTESYILLETMCDPNITARALVTPRSLSVMLSWQEGSGDDLHWNTVKPERTHGGYICSQNIDAEEWGPSVVVHGERKIYPKREDVWRVHVFEVFLDYVNNSLTKFPWIELYEIPSSSFEDGVWVSTGISLGVVPRNSKDERVENIFRPSESKYLSNPMYIP